MGTSQSSSGSPSNVPLVPPWVPDAVPDDGSGENSEGTDGNEDLESGTNPDDGDETRPQTAPPPQSIPIAPPGRFGPARTNLGSFARNGSTGDMRRGVGHYVRKGLGGASTAARRFGATSRTAGTLYGALSTVASGEAASPGSPLDPTLLSGRSADEIMDAVVEAVRPIDGTQDTEAGREAISNALAELLERFPDADLLNLSEDQRVFAVEQYIGQDVFNRFRLDVGKTLQEKAPNVSTYLSRLRDVRDYIRQGVAASFRKIRGSQPLRARRISNMVQNALRDAFDVFEAYLT